MTNISAGNKRPWDGIDNDDSSKRPRAREEPKDWRDVYLRSPSRRPSTRRESPGRRDYRRDSSHRRRSREKDGRRDGRHGRSRDRSRDKSRKDRDYSYRRDASGRSNERSSRRSASPLPARSNGLSHAPRQDDEKEEGEISPRPSPLPTIRESKQQPLKSELPAKEKTTKPVETTKPPEPELELEFLISPPPVEDLAAARRAKRQAILAKYAGQASTTASPSPMLSTSVEPPPDTPIASRGPSQGVNTPDIAPSEAVLTHNDRERETMSRSPEPNDFTLFKSEKDDVQDDANQAPDGDVDQMMAADYDPSLDRREDERKRIGDIPTQNAPVIEEEVEEVLEDEDDIDDMFAVALDDKPKKVKKVVKKKKVAAPALITTATLDSAADPEGYYTIILGEHLDGGTYQVFSSLGKGMFANVVRARVLQGEYHEPSKEVAIKIVRCQESMYKAGLKEIQILNKIKQADPDDKKHLVRLERTFEHRGHLCLVFENLSMNLREVVKRFGKDVGLNIRAVRAYAHQLFLALSLLRKLNIIHADIKPDNILVNEQKTLVKLCDLGSASDASENDITPYLVSRFYRAPEIILGVPYDAALDVWSIGCTLYELYTGKILFPGRSNNQMILLMMELKGRFNSKMIKKAKFGDVFFDEMGDFQSVDKDRLTGADVMRNVHISKPTRDLRARLMPPASVKLKEDEMKMITSFIDLLEKCLTLDPARRITPRDALTHPFIRGHA